MKTYELQVRMIVKFDQDLTKLEACNEVGITLENPPLTATVFECKVTRELPNPTGIPVENPV